MRKPITAPRTAKMLQRLLCIVSPLLRPRSRELLRHATLGPPIEELHAHAGAADHAGAEQPARRIALRHAHQERADAASQAQPRTDAHERAADDRPGGGLEGRRLELELA